MKEQWRELPSQRRLVRLACLAAMFHPNTALGLRHERKSSQEGCSQLARGSQALVGVACPVGRHCNSNWQPEDTDK